MPDEYGTIDGGDGRYIHTKSDKRPHGTRVVTIANGDATDVLVDAEDFMDVQKERDELRRSLHLINAWRWSPEGSVRDFAPLDRLLTAAGLSMVDARAMNAVIASLRSGAIQNSETAVEDGG